MGCSCSNSAEETELKKPRTLISKNKVEDNSNLLSINNKNENLKKNDPKRRSIDDDEDKIIIPPAIKEYVVEEDVINENQYKKKDYKGITILENVKTYFPENINRDEIKNIVYSATKNIIVKDKSKYLKGKNLTEEQVEGIIDVLYQILCKNENIENNEFDDKRLEDVKVNIGFYDANEDNIKRIMFKGKNPSDKEVEDMLNEVTSGDKNAKILAVECKDE